MPRPAPDGAGPAGAGPDGPVPDPSDRAGPAAHRRSALADHLLSVLLPLAVIGLGVALSVGGAGRAVLDLCRAILP